MFSISNATFHPATQYIAPGQNKHLRTACWTRRLTGSHGGHPVLGSLVEERVPEGEEGVARPDRPPDQLHLRLVEQPRLAPLRVDVRVRPAIFNLNVM